MKVDSPSSLRQEGLSTYSKIIYTMKKIHYLATFLALLFLCTTARAGVNASSDYVETFDQVDVSAHDFAPAFWGHIVDSYFDYDYYEEYFVKYQHHTTGGWDGKGYLDAGTQSLGSGWTSTDVNDLLVTPKVSGEISFYLKKTKSSGKVKLFNCTSRNNGFSKGTEIKIENMPTLSTDAWTLVTLTVAEPTHIGFRLQDMGLDDFHAQTAEIALKRSMEIKTVKHTGSSDLMANADNQVEIIFNVTIKNTGDVTLNPGDEGYSLSLVRNKNPEIELGRKDIDIALAPGQTSETIEVKVTCDAGTSKENMRYDIRENMNGATSFGAWITFIPYVPELKIYDSNASTIEKAVDFEIVQNQEHSLQFKLLNNGGAPLDLTEIQAPEGFSLSSELPLHLDKGEETALTITLKPGEEWTGCKDGNIAFIYNDTYRTELPVTGTVLSASTWYEDFEEGIPSDIIHSENWESAPTSSSSLTTPFNKKWAQNKIQNPLTDMITTKMHVTEQDSLVFYAAKRTTYGGELTVSYSADRKEWTEVRHLKYNASNAEDKFSDEKVSYSGNDYKFKKYVVKNIPAGDYYLKFSAGFVCLDNLYGFQKKVEKHDLYVQETNIPNTAVVNNAYTAKITLHNFGELETAGSYAIKMLSGTELIAEAETPDFETGTIQHFDLTFTPHMAGEWPIIITVETAETSTEAFAGTLKVNPESADLIQTVGKGQKSNNNVPLALNYKKSISETIYTAEMLGIESNSEIVRLSYLFYNVNEKKFPANIKIWMQNTTDPLFEGETVEAADTLKMEQVYNGIWNVEAQGSEEEMAEQLFTLDKPFVYTGSNLRVVIQSVADQYSSTSFAVEAVATATTIQKYNDHNLIDATWSKSSYLPVTNFYLKQEVPVLSGTIKDQLTGKVMPNIHLTLRAGEVWYEGTSNEEGVYSIPVIQAYNTYTLAAEVEGYTPYQQEISFDGGNITQDIELMRAMPEEPQECTVKFLLNTVTGESAKNATISLYHNDFGIDYGTKTINANGFCMFNVVSGYYTLQIEKKGFKKYVNENFAIPGNIEFNITLEENVINPFALEAELQHDILTGQDDIQFSWNQEGPAFFDDFENYEDFAITFGAWTGIDRDKEPAAALSGSYKNRGLLQYATICNPLTVTPAWWYDYPVLRAYSGQQYVGFIRTQSGVENDDWLISPQIKVGTNHILRFMAKSGDQFKERFQVGISTGGTEIDDFTIISGGNYEAVGYEDWQEMVYDLSAYEGQEVYIAIHYVSKSYFMLMIDDFYVGPNNEQAERTSQRVPRRSPANPQERFEIYLDGTWVGETESYNYRFEQVTEGKHTLGVKAKYQIGESELSTYEITVPAKDAYASLNVNIQTNNEQVINQEKMELVNKDNGQEYLLDIVNNKVEVASVPKGSYLTSITLDNYEPYQEEIQLEQNLNLKVSLKEKLITPYNLTIDLSEEGGQMNALFKWNQDLGFSDSFETYEDFSSNFGDWTVIDVDQMPVYPIALGDISNVISFPGSGTAETPAATKAMVFNPYKTTPSMESDPNILAPDGKKTVVFFSSQRAASDDWLISPLFKIHENYVWEVTAKAYDMFPEQIEFTVSTSKDPDTFTVIDQVQLSKEWTRYTINLSAYANQEVYLGIHYITNDGFLSQIDEFYVGPDQESNNAAKVGLVDHYEVMLDNVLVAQPTTNSFLFENVAEGAHTASVKAVYKSGASETASINFNAVSGIDPVTDGCQISGGRGYIDCQLTAQASVKVFDATGKLMTADVYEAGNTTINVPAGIYIVQVVCQGNVLNQKVQVF